MKKFLSIILAALLIFSVMTPITVFAENGPYPNDFEKFENMDLENIDITELMNLKLSAIMFLDLGAIVTAPENAIGLVYPEFEELPLPQAYSGATYDMESNTLTLKNVVSKTAILEVLGMGDDFKIKLEGYNELAAIISSGMEWGGSVTLIGDGELVLGRSEDTLFSGLSIEADETASFFHVEDTVKLKFYSNSDFLFDSVSVIGSTITDPAELIQLGGNVVSDEPTFEKYTVEFFEQQEAYDLGWNYYDFYEFGLKKDGAYYIADAEYNEETYEPTGKYIVYALSYDEILDCYTISEHDKVSSFKGYKVLTELEPIYDESLGYYIGYVDFAEEEDIDLYKTIFYPDYKEPFDLCVDENGTKYGFYQFTYEYDDETTETVTYVYNFIDHPTYGLIAIEDTTKTTLDGLTPLKIGEKDYADCYISSDLVINNGGSIIEPAKIKNIKATSSGKGVKVTWSADPVADSYTISRKTSGSKKWVELDTIEADETTFIDKTAKSGKKYTYTVKASNFVGEGASDSKGYTLTYYKAPDVSIKNTTKGVYLKWGKIDGATKYRIYRQTSGSSKWSLIDTVTGTSFTDKTAKSGKKYYYRVRSAKGDVMSGYNEVSKYFLSAPKLSSAKNSASGVKVEWKKVTGADGYNVYRKSGSGSYKKIGTTSKTSYTDKTAKSGTTYTYTVKAYKSKTESSYNTGLSRKYLAVPKAKTTVYTSSISVSWSKISGAKEYAVYRKASGESKYKKIATTSKTSYKDTNVKNNKTYYYQVKAINGKTVSSYNTVKQLFLSTPKLSSIKNDRNGVEFKWAKVSGAEKYRVYRKTGSGDFKLLATTKKTSYLDDTAKSGTVYTYTVKACKDDATSYYNKTGLKIRFVDTGVLYTPTNVKSGIQLRWHDADKVDKYYIYREVDGTNTKKQIAVLDPDDLKRDEYGVLMYVDKTAKNGETYAYYMRVIYKNTYSGYTWSTGKYVTRMQSVDVTSATATSKGIKIKWEKNPYATGYTISREEKGNNEINTFYASVDGSSTTTYLDENVEAGKTYIYSVMANYNKNNGKGGWSAPGGSKSAKAK